MTSINIIPIQATELKIEAIQKQVKINKNKERNRKLKLRRKAKKEKEKFEQQFVKSENLKTIEDTVESITQAVKKLKIRNKNKVEKTILIPRKIHEGDNLRWWNKGQEFYRVFGEWRCGDKKCRKRWSSAFTWLSLNKWEQGYPSTSFSAKELSQQECKKCKNKVNKLTDAHDLEKGSGNLIKPHLAHLCAKCKKGDPCQYRKYY